MFDTAGSGRGNVGKKHREDVLLLFATLVWLVIAVMVPVPAAAQVSGGTVSGAITDAAGAAMPGAKVSLTNMATGAATVMITDTRGFYMAPDLRPDTYDITVSAPGFVTQVRTGIAVAVGARLVLNVAMRPGNPQEISRTAAIVASQSSSAAGGNVSAATVRNTPLNGRDWTQLATLQTGVTGIQTASAAQGNTNAAQRGFGSPISVSGARPDENNYLVDGISINDYSNGAPGSVLGANLGVDAIQQFSVLGSNYPAQYGR
ncbi:MAG: carboxypeptidase regulatory-like domain-containing protein, partial [Terriglobia bacterium]